MKVASSRRREKIRWVTFRQFAVLLKDASAAWNNDGAASMGASIAYYTLFSIAPLLIITMAIAGFFFGDEAARGQVFGQAAGLLGSEGASALQDLVTSASRPSDGIVATVVGLVLTVVGATGVFAELQQAMDRIWQAPAAEKQVGIWSLVRRRLFTFGILLAVAFLLLVSLAISTFISSLQQLWNFHTSAWEPVLQTLNFIVSLGLVAALFAMLYKLLPQVSVAWGDVLTGALLTSVMFNVGKLIIGLYIGKSGVVSAFGAAGSVIAIVVWVYYSAQIFLLGAEFTWIFANRYGSRRSKEAS